MYPGCMDIQKPMGNYPRWRLKHKRFGWISVGMHPNGTNTHQNPNVFLFQRFTTPISCNWLRIQVSNSTLYTQLAMTKKWGIALDIIYVQHVHWSQVNLGKNKWSSPLQRRLIGWCVWKTVALLLGSFLATSVGKKWESSNIYQWSSLL